MKPHYHIADMSFNQISMLFYQQTHSPSGVSSLTEATNQTKVTEATALTGQRIALISFFLE